MGRARVNIRMRTQAEISDGAAAAATVSAVARSTMQSWKPDAA